MSEENAVYGISDRRALGGLEERLRDAFAWPDGRDGEQVYPGHEVNTAEVMHGQILRHTVRPTLALCFKRLAPSAKLPTYSTDGAAGFDLYAAHCGHLEPGRRTLAPIGWAVEVPEGFGLFILPRSGYAAKEGVTVLNAPGLIDSDFRGSVHVLLQNHGTDPVYWSEGDRIAQAVLLETPQVSFYEVDDLTDTTRGDGGWGSTGR
jgi:dUTP pyrophosphatase